MHLSSFSPTGKYFSMSSSPPPPSAPMSRLVLFFFHFLSFFFTSCQQRKIKVGNLLQSSISRPDILYLSKFPVYCNQNIFFSVAGRNYTRLEDIRQDLLRGVVKGALIDSYVAAERKDLFEDPALCIHQVREHYM